MKTQVFYLMCFSFLCFNTQQIIQAQDNIRSSENYTITGIVSDSISGETLIGVNIYLKDTKYGTVSDSKGNFNLEAPGGNYKLVFSYIGYKQKEVSLELNWNVSLNISLRTMGLKFFLWVASSIGQAQKY